VNGGDHQPVRWWLGWVEERVGAPDVVDVVDAEFGVFEQMRGLPVDLEGIVVIELIEIEPLSHNTSVLQTDTSDDSCFDL
jgi:hypothetical protein